MYSLLIIEHGDANWSNRTRPMVFADMLGPVRRIKC